MNRPKWILLLVALAMMGGAAGALGRLKEGQKLGRPGIKAAPIAGSQRLTVYLPERVLDYDSTNIETPEAVLEGLPHDTSFAQRQYQARSDADDWLDMMVVLMGTDRTSIHKPQFCLQGSGWDFDDHNSIEDRVAVEGAHPYDLPITKMSMTREELVNGQSAELSGIYIYWFVADQQLTARHSTRMWKTATHLLETGELYRWAYVGCLAVCRPGEEDRTYARMKRFIAASVPEFQLTPRSSREAGSTAAK